MAFLEQEVNETEREPVLTIPAAAVFEAGGRKQVYVVESGKARLRQVDLGANVGDRIEVHGLDAGTRVIVRPPEGLVDARAVAEKAT